MRCLWLVGLAVLTLLSAGVCTLAASAVVDDRDPGCLVLSPWQSGTDPLAFESHFYWTVGASGPPLRPVIWEFPTALPGGDYRIWIWNPPCPDNTSAAEYSVYDYNGATKVIFDQREGASWRLLSTTWFSMTGPGYYRVELSNLTADAGDSVRVVADAIMFEGVPEPSCGAALLMGLAAVSGRHRMRLRRREP